MKNFKLKNIMKKAISLVISGILLSSCVSQKKFTELEELQQNTKNLLDSATVKLNSCDEEKEVVMATLKSLQEQNNFLTSNNQDLISNIGNLTTLSQKGAENLEMSLESMKEKDLKITRLQDAVNKKDSVTLAIVTSLKKEIGINDPDIEVNVEKGVVFISLSDKLIFKSGSYIVTERAKEILAKVATVVNSKPDFECMVEGHTDSQSFQKGVLLDNWDLSVKRSTSIVRVLETLDVNPQKLIAAGRSFHVPLVDNETATNRSINRRTRIIIMPRIDQFYDMIEKVMKNMTE